MLGAKAAAHGVSLDCLAWTGCHDLYFYVPADGFRQLNIVGSDFDFSFRHQGTGTSVVDIFGCFFPMRRRVLCTHAKVAHQKQQRLPRANDASQRLGPGAKIISSGVGVEVTRLIIQNKTSWVVSYKSEGRQSNTFNCTERRLLNSLTAGAKARSNFPPGNGRPPAFHQTASCVTASLAAP